MLDAMRQAAGGTVAKILLGLLVISFAIWGVSGELGGIGANTLARVGDQEVTALEFDSALRQRIEQLSRQSGAPITMEQANAVGVSQQVLGELLSTAALDDQAADYNLGVSDDKLAARILNDPVFQGPDGQFDRERFRLILQNAGLREDNYVSTFRRSIAREQLAEAIAGGYQDAPTDGRGLYRYQGETRTLSAVTVDAGVIGPIEEPTPEALQAYYDENVAAFRAPEYRKLDVIVLRHDALADPASVTDEAVAAEYERRQRDFTVPERRQVEEIRFDSEEALAAAKSQADAGTAFAAIAEAQGLSPADIDLGLKTRAEIIDPEGRRGGFRRRRRRRDRGCRWRPRTGADPRRRRGAGRHDAARGAFRPASDGTGRTHGATSGSSPFTIPSRTSAPRGGTMAEVAARVGVPHQTIPAVARDGSVPQGDAPVDLPGRAAVLADAFDSDVGIENDPVRTGDGGYVFYEVMEVIPARDRTLDEARDAVVAAWRAAETAERIAARADELFQRLQGGASMDEIATSLGRNVVRAENVTRGSQPPAGFSRNAADAGLRRSGGACRQCRGRRAAGADPRQGRRGKRAGLLRGGGYRPRGAGGARRGAAAATFSPPTTASSCNRPEPRSTAPYSRRSPAPARTADAGRARPRAFRGGLFERRTPVRLDAARRRSRDAGLGVPQARRHRAPTRSFWNRSKAARCAAATP